VIVSYSRRASRWLFSFYAVIICDDEQMTPPSSQLKKEEGENQ
jgi:hypothetical protein